MLKDSKVAARIPAQDLQRARSLYAEKLGLQPSEQRPGGLLYRREPGTEEVGGFFCGYLSREAWRYRTDIG